ncbi:hypothetical protein SK128_006509 [Halocaridina rubra]|uniref:Uncharacterized protein n=1 Tax=Halocaridina rubra TaxID=373956 RepID=A0AAN9A7N5_HALRR
MRTKQTARKGKKKASVVDSPVKTNTPKEIKTPKEAKTKVIDPLGVFLFFPELITDDTVKALLDKFKGAKMKFSRAVTLHFKNEEEASKARTVAANAMFAGVKPTIVGEAYLKHESKRPAPEESECVQKKKVKANEEKVKVKDEVKSEEKEADDDDKDEEEEEEVDDDEEEEEEDDEEEEEDE